MLPDNVKMGVCDFCGDECDVAVSEEGVGRGQAYICGECAQWALEELAKAEEEGD